MFVNLWKFNSIFAIIPTPMSLSMTDGWENMTYEKRLLDVLFLLLRNFATFRCRQDKATVDAHGYAMVLVSVFFRYRLSISAWASALLVLLHRACEGL